jgi:hypothetical protein
MTPLSIQNSTFLQSALNTLRSHKGLRGITDADHKTSLLVKKILLFTKQLESKDLPLPLLSKKKIAGLNLSLKSFVNNTTVCNFEKLIGILLNLGLLKSLLQLEVFIFQMLEMAILTNIKILNDPLLESLWIDLPGIFGKIEIVREPHPCITLPIECVKSYFNSVRLQTTNLSFHSMLLQLIEASKIDEDKLHIPVEKIINIDAVKPLISSEDRETRVLAQLIYACNIEKQLLEGDSVGISDILQKSLGLITFFKDFAKKLTPDQATYISCTPILKVMLIAFRKLPTLDVSVFFEKRILEEFSTLITNSWIDECADFYEYLLKLENFIKLHVPKLDKIDETISVGAFPILAKAGDTLRNSDSDRKFPIYGTKFFCESREEFLNLVFVNRSTRSSDTPVTVESGLITHHHPFDPRFFEALSCRTPTPTTPERLSEAPLEEIASPLSHFIDLTFSSSMDYTRSFLAEIRYHPRVMSWFESIDSGLKYYDYKAETDPFGRQRHRLITRHHFPSEILTFAFNPIYSQKTFWTSPAGELIDVYRSVILINSKPHILEANLCSEKVLYHFYAKPIEAVEDYFTIIQDSDSIFPALKDVAIEKPTLRISLENPVVVEANGNVAIKFEGNTYTISRLKK